MPKRSGFARHLCEPIRLANDQRVADAVRGAPMAVHLRIRHLGRHLGKIRRTLPVLNAKAKVADVLHHRGALPHEGVRKARGALRPRGARHPRGARTTSGPRRKAADEAVEIPRRPCACELLEKCHKTFQKEMSRMRTITPATKT